jgi:hypothetical protein
MTNPVIYRCPEFKAKNSDDPHEEGVRGLKVR